MPIFSCYLFKIKLSYFKWNISIKDLILVILVFLIYYSPKLILYGLQDLKINSYYSISDYIFSILNTLIFNSIYEEIVFRGFLVSGLKDFKLNDLKINIFQSIIFSIPHLYQFISGLISMLGLSYHIIVGYLLGKIYLKTKSLTPSIVLHLLTNTV